MASKFLCICGAVIRKNIYEGHHLHLLVPEELTDILDEKLTTPCEKFIDTLFEKSLLVATCANCGSFAVINDNNNCIKFYAPVNQ
jgi:hypothetical protein